MENGGTRIVRGAQVAVRAAAALLCAGAWLMVSGGCTVGQPAGLGRTLTLQEPALGATYYVYLPVDYRESGPPHPVVVTFHGMKPFDSPGAQIREWQSEADRYGYIVLAPTLRVSALGSPLPLPGVSGALRDDERSSLSAMDEVFRTTHADPGAVLATSWSYGGYVAHYMVNRHPDRFSCLAVKQSNFNAALLTDATVPAYVDKPLAVFYTTNDFRICREESQEAALWYARRGFDVTFARFEGRGHERTPGPAAAFFARSCGARAKSPPWELALLQVVDPVTLSDVEPTVANLATPADDVPRERPDIATVAAESSTKTPPTREGPRAPAAISSRPHSAPQPAEATSHATDALPLRIEPLPGSGPKPAAPTPAPEVNVISISAGPVISVAPLTVTFRAFVPAALREGSLYQWSVDDRPLSRATSGQATLSEPGDYTLRLTVTDRAGREYTATKPLTVLERAQPEQR